MMTETMAVALFIFILAHVGQLYEVHSDPAIFILRQQLRRCSAVWIIRIINVRNLLSVSVSHDVVVRLEFGGPGWWEVTR